MQRVAGRRERARNGKGVYPIGGGWGYPGGGRWLVVVWDASTKNIIKNGVRGECKGCVFASLSVGWDGVIWWGHERKRR